MNYKNLIRNWHTKATEEDYFSKFVFEYLAFIAHLKTQLFTTAHKDREAIQQLKKDTNIKRKYIGKIQSNQTLKRAWQKIKQKLDNVRLGNASQNLNEVEEIKWWNCSHDNINQMTAEERGRAKGVIHSLGDWGNMVEFWYSIRNNLFHGAKDPERERDQSMVEYGYKSLKELMEILLNETN